MDTKSISTQIKQSINGDEYYSPQNVVDMIVPYILRGGVQKHMVPLRYRGKQVCSDIQ